MPISILRALSVLIPLLSAAALAAEPALPTGLGGASEPELPAGMEAGDSGPPLPGGLGSGDEPDLPAGIDEPRETAAFDDWEVGDSDDTEAPLGGLTGFWEARAGHRLQSADNQRQSSLAEMRLELEKGWQGLSWSAKATADLVYDSIEDSGHADLETGMGWLDLREVWLQWRPGADVDLKVGRQILTWGVGDLVFINDLFPKDWNSFLAGRDEQYLKAPSDALRVGYYGDGFNLNLVYTPRFDADRYIDGRRLSYYNPLVGGVVGRNEPLSVDRPDDTGVDDEWALRLYRRWGSYELALYGYDGFWKSPGGFDPRSGRARFPRLRVAGASGRGPLGPGILSLEVGYYDSLEDDSGDDPFVNNDEWRFLAGYEWEVARETTLGLQYYLEAMGDYGAYRRTLPAGQPARDQYRQLVTVRLTRQALNQNLTLGLFAYYSPTDEDAYLRPNIHYKVTDNLAVEGGFNLFFGDRDHTFFGQFEDNSNVYTAVRFSF